MTTKQEHALWLMDKLNEDDGVFAEIGDAIKRLCKANDLDPDDYEAAIVIGEKEEEDISDLSPDEMDRRELLLSEAEQQLQQTGDPYTPEDVVDLANDMQALIDLQHNWASIDEEKNKITGEPN